MNIILIILGALGLLFVSRRQFCRRNQAGVEEFRSFGAALGSNILEWIIRIISMLLIGVGLVLTFLPQHHL